VAYATPDAHVVAVEHSAALSASWPDCESPLTFEPQPVVSVANVANVPKDATRIGRADLRFMPRSRERSR
jgi:hypothetical protein